MRQWNKRERNRDANALIRAGMVVATYDQPLIATLGSIQEQTHDNFICLVIHDGPKTKPFLRAEQIFSDDHRFVFRQCGDVRANQYGHNLRRFGFKLLTHRGFGADMIGTSNGDNYYAPVYFEAMLDAIAASNSTKWAICDMVHSHRLWKEVISKPERKFVDAGNWMATREVVESVDWDKTDFAADWDFVSRVKEKYGEPAKVNHTLFVHN